jgi:hypothetical protein
MLRAAAWQRVDPWKHQICKSDTHYHARRYPKLTQYSLCVHMWLSSIECLNSADGFVQIGPEDLIHARDLQFSSFALVELGRRVVLDDAADLLLVGLPVLLEQVEGIGLGGRLWVGLVEERLDTEQNLPDGDGGLPAFFLVQDGQADGAGRVDVWVEERRGEFTWQC